jgi:hypothetical protein
MTEEGGAVGQLGPLMAAPGAGAVARAWQNGPGACGAAEPPHRIASKALDRADRDDWTRLERGARRLTGLCPRQPAHSRLRAQDRTAQL